MGGVESPEGDSVFCYPIPPVVDRFQNKYSSNHKAERHTLHQTDYPIALL